MPGRLAPLIAVVALTAGVVACTPSAAALDRQYEHAQQQLRRGQVDEVLTVADAGVGQAERANDAVRGWRFRLLMADAHITKLEFPAALTLLEQPVPEPPEFAPIRGRQLHLQARIRVAQGQLAPAAPLIEAALPLAGGDPALRLDLELLKSQLLYRTGRAADADALLASARTRVEGEGDAYRRAQVANTIGMGLVTRGRYDEALPFFDGILSERSIEGTSMQGAALNNAGICHARLGQFDRAVILQQQAVRVQQQGRKRDYAQALGELGSTYLLQDDLTRGAELLQQAFAIASEAGLASDAALFARNLAAALIRMGRWDEAGRFNEEAARFDARVSGAPSPYGTVTAAQVAAGRGRTDEAARLFAQALAAPDVPPGVRWMSHDGLARLAADAQRPDEAAAQFEAALKTLEETRSALLRADYRISFTSRLMSFYGGYVDLLLREGQIERALEVADSSRARVLAERQGVTALPKRTSVAALKQLARRSKSTLLFYWLGSAESRVWSVTADRVTAMPVPRRADIDALVAAHQSAIQNAMADPLAAANSAGDALYQHLIQPVAATVLPGTSVVIVPDGSLHRLNFETLPVPGSPKHYWIEDVTVQIAPSLGMLQTRPGEPARPAPGTPSLLLVGNPTPRAPEFPALSYAAAEMSSVTKHFASGSVTSLDAARASPAAFMAAQPERFAVIHFTSHAVANLENPLDSAVILSGPDQAFKLYARDVASLPLTAELVTVSACRSAGERDYAGEGLVGFAWAFLRAGSRRVVAGLWDVDDRSTAALMDSVYAGMAGGATPAAALRAAKLALIRGGFPKPFYWAPFQLFTVSL